MKQKAKYLKPIKPLIIYNKLDQRVNFASDAELVRRFRETNAWKTKTGNFERYQLAYDIVREVYGKIDKTDFDSNSAMACFFTSKQNLIWKMLDNEKLHVG